MGGGKHGLTSCFIRSACQIAVLKPILLSKPERRRLASFGGLVPQREGGDLYGRSRFSLLGLSRSRFRSWHCFVRFASTASFFSLLVNICGDLVDSSVSLTRRIIESGIFLAIARARFICICARDEIRPWVYLYFQPTKQGCAADEEAVQQHLLGKRSSFERTLN